MSPFVAEHAGLIELTLVEGIVLAIAFRELWSVRRSQRGARPPEPPATTEAPADAAPSDRKDEGN